MKRAQLEHVNVAMTNRLGQSSMTESGVTLKVEILLGVIARLGGFSGVEPVIIVMERMQECLKAETAVQ